MTPRVIWITALSASGRSTLAWAIVDALRPDVHAVMLDGDRVRALFDDDLGFAECDRVVQIGRMQRLASWLVNQGQVVVVAALCATPALLAWTRSHLPGYFEIYLKPPLETLMARDPRGLYARAMSGAQRNVVGIDIPWQEPASPDLVFDLAPVGPPAVTAAQALARLAGGVPAVGRAR